MENNNENKSAELDDELIGELRSGQAIVDMAAAVVQLVANSLDAGCARVRVRCHMARSLVEVSDDGCGMSAGDLAHVGERYATSKLRSLDEWQSGRVATYGYHGEALANIVQAAASGVQIFTRCASQLHAPLLLKTFSSTTTTTTTTTTLECSSVNTDDETAPPIMIDDRHGTCVRVFNLFGKHALRQHAQQGSTSSKEWRRLVRSLETLALASWRVVLELVDLEHDAVVISSSSSSSSSFSGSSSLATRFKELFGHYLAKSLLEHTWSSGDGDHKLPLSVSGFISASSSQQQNQHLMLLVNEHRRRNHGRLRFVFINRQPVHNAELHKLIVDELYACKPFALVHSAAGDRQQQLIYCIILRCERIGHLTLDNTTGCIEFTNHFTYQQYEAIGEALRCYVRSLLVAHDYSLPPPVVVEQREQEQRLVESDQDDEDGYGKRLCVDDLRFTKVSKVATRETLTGNVSAPPPVAGLDERLLRIYNATNTHASQRLRPCRRRDAIRLHATSALTRNKKALRRHSTTRTRRRQTQRLNFETVRKRLMQLYGDEARRSSEEEALCRKRRRFVSRMCQTDPVGPQCVSEPQSSSAGSLKQGWLAVKDDDGLEFYVNVADGRSTYRKSEITIADLSAGGQEVSNIPNPSAVDDLYRQFEPRSSRSSTFATTTTATATSVEAIAAIVSKAKLDVERVKNAAELDVVAKWRHVDEMRSNRRSAATAAGVVGAASDHALNLFDVDDEANTACKFDRSIFAHVQVVGQMDLKFIVALAKLDTNTSPNGWFIRPISILSSVFTL